MTVEGLVIQVQQLVTHGLGYKKIEHIFSKSSPNRGSGIPGHEFPGEGKDPDQFLDGKIALKDTNEAPQAYRRTRVNRGAFTVFTKDKVIRKAYVKSRPIQQP
jgi:hypothetical protein